MNNPVPRYTGLILLAMIAFLFSACTSAEELMEDGARLEDEGRYEEAIRKYIQAYDKDASIVDLDAQITDLGNRVVADLIAEADAASDGGHPVESAETYMRIDDLVLRAFEVGIRLERPSDYSDRRYSVFRSAVASLTETALQLFRAGDFGGADATFRRALDQFDPNLEETQELLLGRYEVLLAWADQATAAGHYRESTGRADEAVAVAEHAGVRPDAALAIRAMAIDLGTLYVAAAPARSRQRSASEMSPWFLDEVNDRLELDYWSQSPEFIAMAHGALVRQRLRHLRIGRRPLSRRDARRLAIDLDADLAVTTEIERFSGIEKDIREQSKRARAKSGDEVTYQEIQGKLEYYVLVNVLIVDRDGHVLLDDHVEQRRHRDFKRAEYDGDYRDLDLSRSERKLFGRHHYEDVQAALEEDLAVRIAERVADKVFGRLQREIR